MKYRSFFFIGVLLFAGLPFSFAAEYYRDLYPDTWAGTDALGRTMPTYEDVGPVKTDQRRVVGIFYITWHTQHLAGMKSPYTADVSKILKQDPTARLDGHHPLWTESSYHWGEPELGYFLSQDEYVIRKDISMLSDAGVDVLVMDVTNAVRYWDEWDVLFSLMLKMRKEGNKTPQFIFWAFNGPCIVVVQDLYERIYKPGKYQELWFYWDGKPLLLYNGTPWEDSTGKDIKNPNPKFDPAAATDSNHPHFGDPQYTQEFLTDYSEEVKNFFTLRTMWWGYYQWAGKRAIGTEDYWSFGYDLGDKRVQDLKPEELLSLHNGVREQAAVTPAQHPSSLIGKSWSRAGGQPELNEYDLPVPTFVPWLGKTVEHPEGYGIYFQERWDEALRANPQFLYINDWNEWTAGKYAPAEGQTFPFMRRHSNYFFVDQYNAEFNRAIQPMKGGYTDNYYMQMAQNIRRYKGVRPVPEHKGIHEVVIDGEFNDWQAITTEYRDTFGDTCHRDHKGYGGLHYTDSSGRNDILTSKVGATQDEICFYVETRDPLTSHTDPHWMLLFLDIDKNHDTGWYGFDYLINKTIINENTTALLQYAVKEDGSNEWVEVSKINYRYAGRELELEIPRNIIGLKEDTITFDFKWADNPLALDDPIALCIYGDTAPNRRFEYQYRWVR